MGDATPGDEDLTRRVDEACDRFEADWAAGRRPRLEGALAGVPGPGRPELLRELLKLELAYRRKALEWPTPAVYRGRFPGHTGPIAEAFGEEGPPPGPGAGPGRDADR